MRLTDIVASAVGNATAKLGGAAFKLGRTATLYAICMFCVVVAVVFATSASLIALEPAVGTVYARLILAGVFALVAAAIVLTVWALNRPRHARVQAVPLQAQQAQTQAARSTAQFAQLAMIVEAVLLGYSMSRKR